MNAYLPVALASVRGWERTGACRSHRPLLDLCDRFIMLRDEWQRT